MPVIQIEIANGCRRIAVTLPVQIIQTIEKIRKEPKFEVILRESSDLTKKEAGSNNNRFNNHIQAKNLTI